MVASDTVVGLVGAGILLVALVGVFIIESKEAPTTGVKKLDSVTYAAAASGDFATAEGEEPNNALAPNVCFYPPDDQSQDCAPSETSVDLMVSGLPVLNAESGLHYNAFLVKGSEVVSLGPVMAMGNGSHWTYNAEAFYAPPIEIKVTIEHETAADAPSGLEVFATTATGGAISGTAMLNLTMAMEAPTYTMSEAGGNVEGEVSFLGFSNHTGYNYTAWILDETNATHYEHLGDFTLTAAGNDTVDGLLSFTLAGHELSELGHLVITLEPMGATHEDDHAEEHPLGIIVYRGDVNE